MDGWNTSFLLGRPIFRGSVSFREGNLHCHIGVVFSARALSIDRERGTQREVTLNDATAASNYGQLLEACDRTLASVEKKNRGNGGEENLPQREPMISGVVASLKKKPGESEFFLGGWSISYRSIGGAF